MNFVLAILITPFVYLGGVFFEVSKLEGLLSLSRFINPFYPLINITRFTYLGIGEGNLLWQLLIAAVFLVGAYGVALYTLKKGVGIKVD